MTLKLKTFLSTLACSAALLSGCAHTAATAKQTHDSKMASEASSSFDVKTTSCWDVLTIAEEDMNMAMMLIYGYSQGTKGVSQQSSSSIEAAFTKAFTFCETNPDATVIKAFE